MKQNMSKPELLPFPLSHQLRALYFLSQQNGATTCMARLSWSSATPLFPSCLSSNQPPVLISSTSSVQFSSGAQPCPTLCDPMGCSTPGFPVHHQLPEFTQTHVHRNSDAIQPSHPLSSHSPTFNLFK